MSKYEHLELSTDRTTQITLGSNVKITAPRSVRPHVRAMFEALGASRGGSGEWDLFAVPGGDIGFNYVPDADALTPAQMRIAPWLEIGVPDVDTALARLDALGLARLDYDDRTHAYFVGPGGVVFRLAATLR